MQVHVQSKQEIDTWLTKDVELGNSFNLHENICGYRTVSESFPPPPFLPPSFTSDDHVSLDGLVSHGASEGFLWWPVGSRAEAWEGDARHAARADAPAAALAAQPHVGV